MTIREIVYGLDSTNIYHSSAMYGNTIWISYEGGGYSTCKVADGEYQLSLGSGNSSNDRRPIASIEHAGITFIVSNEALQEFLLTHQTQDILHQVFIHLMGFVFYHTPHWAFEAYTRSHKTIRETAFVNGQDDVRNKFKELMEIR